MTSKESLGIPGPPSDEPGEVMAAGGIVWRRTVLGRRLALVARTHRTGGGMTEWTLPKGHVEPGETLEAAARREVEEETGWRVVVRGPAGEIGYQIPSDAEVPDEDRGRRKRVAFWHMRAVARYEAGRDPTKEVTEVRWCSPRRALTALTHREQADLLADQLPSPEGLVPSWVRAGSTRWRNDRLLQALAIYGVQLEARAGPSRRAGDPPRSRALQQLWDEASALLDVARRAQARGDLNGGWDALFAAQEREVLVWGGEEVTSRSRELLAEADRKLSGSWRGTSIVELLDWVRAPEGDETAGALSVEEKAERLSRAMRLRNESFSNRYRGFDNTKRQLVVLGSIAAFVAILLTALLISEVVPVSRADAPTSDQVLGVVLFGALGGAFSGALSLLRAGPRGVPDSLVEGWTTTMRPVVGAVGALAAFAFLAAGVLGIDGGEAAYAVAFAAGFSERLVSKAAEALSG